ncbi:MAG: hypothetical protein DIU80_009405 [Chloroflexota bacterium]
MRERSHIKPMALLVFWGLFLILFLNGASLDRITATFLTLRSEYTVTEQLSKFLLLLVIFVAVLAYSQLRRVPDTQSALAFLALGLIMYLAESNMVAEELTLPVGAALFGLTLTLLVRQRAWVSAALVVAVCLVTLASVLHDFVDDGSPLAMLLPGALRSPLMMFHEEYADTLGQALLCTAALVRFGDLLAGWVLRARAALFLLLGCVGLLAIGDSFLHYQYSPSIRLQIVALTLALAGFAGGVIANHYLLPRPARLTLHRERHFYAFLYLFFVGLPATYREADMPPFVLLWGPAVVYWLWHLYAQRARPRESREPAAMPAAQQAPAGPGR